MLIPSSQRLPKMAMHLQSISMRPSMYASQWFMTVFSYNFPFDVVVRIWDIFLAEGWKIVFRVALALLQLSASECCSRRSAGCEGGARWRLVPYAYARPRACARTVHMHANAHTRARACTHA